MHILRGFSIVTTTESKLTDESKKQKIIKVDNEMRIVGEVFRKEIFQCKS